MNENHRKKFLVLWVCAILIVGAFALIMVVVTKTTEVNTEAEADAAKDSTKSNTSSTSPEKEAAEKLINETVSKKKIKKNVGDWDKFVMDSNGCERGVYAGKFYYEEFTIFSRTYDKGKTFRIVSVN